MKGFGSVLLMSTVAWTLAACHTASRQAVAPTPETEQVVSEALKQLYMAASMAPSHSPEQQKLILRMAQKATNGKELLLVMRAAIGVFPSSAASGEQAVESQVRSMVTAKMIDDATLDQMIDYAKEYAVDAHDARRFVERMMELGQNASDAHVWYRIRAVAFHLKLSDLEQQAQSRGEQLAPR
jgi:hypothetical protein